MTFLSTNRVNLNYKTRNFFAVLQKNKNENITVLLWFSIPLRIPVTIIQSCRYIHFHHFKTTTKRVRFLY